LLAQSVYERVVCVCCASTRDDPDERQQLLTADTAAAHSDVAQMIPLARLDQPDVDQQTEAIPSTAGTPTLPSSSKIIFCRGSLDPPGGLERGYSVSLRLRIQYLDV